jgi:hypothetical protein
VRLTAEPDRFSPAELVDHEMTQNRVVSFIGIEMVGEGARVFECCHPNSTALALAHGFRKNRTLARAG